MDFKNEKYEYLLHTWGGFYNEKYAKKHGKKSGYFFFVSWCVDFSSAKALFGFLKLKKVACVSRFAQHKKN